MTKPTTQDQHGDGPPLPATENQMMLELAAIAPLSPLDGFACDASEAPDGHYAVLKSVAAPKDDSNICRACDWRKTCQAPETDLLAYGHRCMSYAVVANRDGKTYQRRDRCSVVFKNG